MSESPDLPSRLGPREPRVPEADRAEIERAIEAAEQTTGAEFVVAVAARSGRYDRAEDLFGLLFGLLGVTGAWIAFQEIVPDPGAWTTGSTVALGLPLVLGIFAAWTVLGAVLATRIPILARPFITSRQMDDEVRERAGQAYWMFKIDRAPEAAGVLIYVSLLERRVLIAPGDGIGTKLPAGAFDGVRDALIADIRAARPVGHALAGAVERAARVVAPAVPPQPKPRNVLPNTVRLLA